MGPGFWKLVWAITWFMGAVAFFVLALVFARASYGMPGEVGMVACLVCACLSLLFVLSSLAGKGE